MSFSVQILGTSSAVDAFGRHQSAQIFRTNGRIFLIDCGEGTQARLKKFKINTNKITDILISHLHGDHYLGLVGLLSTMSLLGRKKPLSIFAPHELKEIIRVQFMHSGTVINYPITFNETQAIKPKKILETQNLIVKTLPLIHGVPCTGFLFQEKPRPYRINPDKLPSGLTKRVIMQLKAGKDVVLENGDTLIAAELTLPPKLSRSYVYCSDTLYNEDLIPEIKNASLLYHESTFLDKHENKATGTNHSTCKQAATLASKANVKHLILGHFSARYRELDEFNEEAQQTFANSEVAIEGTTYTISDIISEPTVSKK